MKILFVSQMVPYLPCRDGFRIIPANLLVQLGREHEIHLVALAGEGEEERDNTSWAESFTETFEMFPCGGELSMTHSRGTGPETPMERRVRDRIDELEPDVLHVEGLGLASLARLVPEGAPVLKLLSAHDSLSLRYAGFARHGGLRSRLRNHALRALARRFEKRWCRFYDHVVVTSEADRAAISASVPPRAGTRFSVVPNGVDLDFFKYAPTPSAAELVFTGNMSWPPNVDAATHFATAVLPRLRAHHDDLRFSIVGADPTPGVRALAGIPGVHVTGTVPDLRPWVWNATVYVGPLRFGVGVKNKILEAMALGAPVVASSQSFTGTPVVDGQHARIADSPEQFSKSLLELLVDEEARSRLSRFGRDLVESCYTWESVGARFAELYGGGRSARAAS